MTPRERFNQLVEQHAAMEHEFWGDGSTRTEAIDFWIVQRGVPTMPDPNEELRRATLPPLPFEQR